MSEPSRAAADRRRRGTDFVTKNACVECKRKRTKAGILSSVRQCDGQNPCARCISQDGVVCHYEVSVRVSKGTLKAEIERLQDYQQSSEFVFGKLASGNHVDFIVQELQNGKTLRDIQISLGGPLSGAQANGYSLPPSEISSTNDYSENSSQQDYSGVDKEDGGRGISGDQDTEPELGTYEDAEPWTTITSDNDLIEHLLSLYACWEYPIFASFAMQHFRTDFKAGRRRYCSSMLLNGILAVGCLFTGGANVHPSSVSGEAFFAEAERLWVFSQNNPSFTTIQALGVMSLFEASRGRDAHSLFFSGQSIRMAVEMGLHGKVKENEIMTDIEREVRSATIWGASIAWSTVMRRVPHLSLHELPTIHPTRPEPEEHRQWLPHTGDGIEVDERLTQMSHARTIHLAMCSLFEILHKSLYVLHIPARLLHSQDVLKIYTRYLAWLDSLDDTIRLGGNSTPPAIFMHMFYHFAILLVFSPFIKIRFIDSIIVPYEICSQAVNAILSLLSSYRHLYTLRRTPCFVPFIALASNAMDLIRIPPEVMLQNIANLREMAFSHVSAARGADLLEFKGQAYSTPAALASQDDIAQRVSQRRESVSEILNEMFKTSIDISAINLNSFLAPPVDLYAIPEPGAATASV
ncbi:Nitrogen assimilation transcription factor nit-4 [Hyphodiscus hymeniophilus]|uniref:Nitrogen assimilation transcription factor nit-4 n=1 Tax=Hyphodiscus hymeniophilus TaxID=353542 RepID=A0A9P7AXP0_9HELO|nr:Nitrogen assimilation transcription factor nit-4 [Hyphodiscus hymeniophilus]